MSLFGRVKKMLFLPNVEWKIIAEEEPDHVAILVGYVLPLAAVPVVAGFIGAYLWSFFDLWIMKKFVVGDSFSRDFPFGSEFLAAIIQYVLGVATVYIVALVFYLLAGAFASEKNFGRALQLAAYSFTASWVGGAALCVPVLGWIVWFIGCLYTLAIMAMGVSPVMRTPGNKTPFYLIVALITAVLGFAVLTGIVRFLVKSLDLNAKLIYWN